MPKSTSPSSPVQSVGQGPRAMPGVSRRTLTRGAAWTAPVLVVGARAPLAIASPSTDACQVEQPSADSYSGSLIPQSINKVYPLVLTHNGVTPSGIPYMPTEWLDLGASAAAAATIPPSPGPAVSFGRVFQYHQTNVNPYPAGAPDPIMYLDFPALEAGVRYTFKYAVRSAKGYSNPRPADGCGDPCDTAATVTGLFVEGAVPGYGTRIAIDPADAPNNVILRVKTQDYPCTDWDGTPLASCVGPGGLVVPGQGDTCTPADWTWGPWQVFEAQATLMTEVDPDGNGPVSFVPGSYRVAFWFSNAGLTAAGCPAFQGSYDEATGVSEGSATGDPIQVAFAATAACATP